MTKLKQLTKYSNRKFYSKSDTSYVNLEEIFELEKSGTKVIVTDHKTGEVITERALAAALLLKAKNGMLNCEAALRKIIKRSK